METGVVEHSATAASERKIREIRGLGNITKLIVVWYNASAKKTKKQLECVCAVVHTGSETTATLKVLQRTTDLHDA